MENAYGLFQRRKSKFKISLSLSLSLSLSASASPKRNDAIRIRGHQRPDKEAAAYPRQVAVSCVGADLRRAPDTTSARTLFARGCVQSAPSREWGKLRLAPARWLFAEQHYEATPVCAHIPHSRQPINQRTPDDRFAHRLEKHPDVVAASEWMHQRDRETRDSANFPPRRPFPRSLPLQPRPSDATGRQGALAPRLMTPRG